MTHIDTAWGQDPTAPVDSELSATYTIAHSRRHDRLTFTGKCPYCRGSVNSPIELNVVPSEASAYVAQGVSELIVVIDCTCPQAHAGRPPGQRGCGQSWSIILEEAA